MKRLEFQVRKRPLPLQLDFLLESWEWEIPRHATTLRRRVRSYANSNTLSFTQNQPSITQTEGKGITCKAAVMMTQGADLEIKDIQVAPVRKNVTLINVD